MPAFDMHIVLEVLGIAFVGGAIGLDRTAAGQFMVSQPIVAGPLAGWMLGEPRAGIIVGAALELIWVLDMPIGTFVPADATIGTVSATAIAVLGAPSGATLPLIGFSILLSTAMVTMTMKAEGAVRTWNLRFSEKALSTSGPNTGHALFHAQCAGLALFFLKSFVLYCIFIPLGIAATGLYRHLPGAFPRALSLFVKLLPLVGVALVVRKLTVKSFDQYVLAGFATAVLFGQLIHAPGIVVLLLTAVVGWIGARYSERRS
ncbi:MAG TPA: PTS sugar transporter subunit IIC [Nitrospirota bacterium]|nr:PTS sugar transporter subunit IIC [Nitrospirota bacterium]